RPTTPSSSSPTPTATSRTCSPGSGATRHSGTARRRRKVFRFGRPPLSHILTGAFPPRKVGKASRAEVGMAAEHEGAGRTLDGSESAWRRGERPDLAGLLPEGPRRRQALLDLVHVELELRLKAGESARVEDYLTR